MTAAQEVNLGAMTAEALDEIVCHVGRVNVSMPDMAWLWFVAQELPDEQALFPMGKWATIQHIEAQLRHAARARALEEQQP